MADKYADIIKIREGKPAYNIVDEEGSEWKTFIPNKQFNEVLSKVLDSVRCQKIDLHKSFWINGTYGTGKSHAASVIAHLLGDAVEEIREWVDYEYKEKEYELIRNSVYSLRKEKRLLPVRIKGRENLTHVSELASLIQTKVTTSLGQHNIDIVVQTDYGNLITHINNHTDIWTPLIERDPDLHTFVGNKEQLIEKLQGRDPSILQRARSALRKAGIQIMLQQENLENWLIDIQEKLRQATTYKGLLIMWDEFTEVMEDAIGIPVLKALQTVAERFMAKSNDSFIFLISHPSAFNTLGAEATRQTDGRYHRMKYNMESVSAFKIMSRKFEITDEEQYKKAQDSFYSRNDNLLELYTEKSNDKEETKRDLINLFPLHPGTANLATHYATTVGSSSRSVFEFIGGNEAMSKFLNDEQAFTKEETITADFLWDFVLKEFQDDIVNYGPVTERFNTYRQAVEEHGKAATAIFKAILLLNAFNNVAADKSVAPTEVNVSLLFQGTQYEEDVASCLNWINENGIIQKSPMGTFSVQFSALPVHETEEIKCRLKEKEYHFTSQVLNMGETARSFFSNSYIQKVIHPCTFNFYSEDVNDSILVNKIRKDKRGTRPCDLYLALFFPRNEKELSHLRELAKDYSIAGNADDTDLRDVIYVVLNTIWEDKNYERFVEYMAFTEAATTHSHIEEARTHKINALSIINEWMTRTKRGNAIIWINGRELQISINDLANKLNSEIGPSIFPKSADSLESLRNKAAATFWKPQVSRDIIRRFLSINSKEELLNINGAAKPVYYLVEEVLDENLNWKTDSAKEHPLRAVYDSVNSSIEDSIQRGKTEFDLIEQFDVFRKPPFGFNANYASGAMLAFAMRPWINKTYNSLGKPRSIDNLTEDIALLLNYWEKGTKRPDLTFTLQTAEERKLSQSLINLLKLNSLQDYSDISSLKDTKYAITGGYIKSVGYPLWSLKYIDSISSDQIILNVSDEIKHLIDNIVTICQNNGQTNAKLIQDTNKLITNHFHSFKNILTAPKAFNEGFYTFLRFLCEQNKVEIKEEEFGNAFEYIKRNLQSDVGFWTEEEVKTALLLWRIASNDDAKQKSGTDSDETGTGTKDPSGKTNTTTPKGAETTAKKQEIVRRFISNTDNAETLRIILSDIVDVGNDFILDAILKRIETNA